MPRKTEFELANFSYNQLQDATISIVGEAPKNKPYVNIKITDAKGVTIICGIDDRDLERFAVNILKALGSKKLALSQRYKSKDFFKKKKTTTHG